MDHSTESIKSSLATEFSSQLNEKLIQKFGKKFSSNMFARDFNLRAEDKKSISRETARKWLRGMAFPEPDKLKILADWLEFDLNKIFKNKSISPNGVSELPDLAKILEIYRPDFENMNSREKINLIKFAISLLSLFASSQDFEDIEISSKQK